MLERLELEVWWTSGSADGAASSLEAFRRGMIPRRFQPGRRVMTRRAGVTLLELLLAVSLLGLLSAGILTALRVGVERHGEGQRQAHR